MAQGAGSEAGQWIDAPVRSESYVIIVGDMLERFTNGLPPSLSLSISPSLPPSLPPSSLTLYVCVGVYSDLLAPFLLGWFGFVGGLCMWYRASVRHQRGLAVI